MNEWTLSFGTKILTNTFREYPFYVNYTPASEKCIRACRNNHQFKVFNPKGATVFKYFLQYSSLLVGFEPSVLSISVILHSFKKQL